MFSYRVRVRWADTDASGRIHNTAALRYFEEAAGDLFRHLGLSLEAGLAGGLDFPRVHVECDYLLPLGFDDALEIRVFRGRVGESSFALECEGWLLEEGPWGPLLSGARGRPIPSLALRGKLVIVTVDRQKGESTRIPHELRQALEQLSSSSKPS
ncbi:MAG: thioesterase family protein [Bacillota bacterium]|nr:thioesterase family protein [Bacillota bacterium]